LCWRRRSRSTPEVAAAPSIILDKGNLTYLKKIDGSQCLAEDDSKFELDRLKMGVDPLAAGCLQGAEQSIAPRMISLTFGHSDIV
jgi:hypothetical protein